MKHRIRITGWCITWMMLLCACENYLDLTPKGATLLDNLTEIEYLLNGNYTNSAYEFEDLYVMTNDTIDKKRIGTRSQSENKRNSNP